MRRKTRTRTGRAAWGPWSLVIDTDSYAGNFERDLVAYAFGLMPAGRSTDYFRALVDDYMTELSIDGPNDERNPLFDLVGYGINDPGDDDIHRAHSCIYPSPRKRARGSPPYNSVRVFLERKPTAKQIALIKKRSLAFAKRGNRWGTKFKIAGFRLIRERTVTQSVKL